MQTRRTQNSKRRSFLTGFTILELVIVMILLGIVSAVVIPKADDVFHSAKVTATKKEMKAIKVAILGDPRKGILGYFDNMDSQLPHGNSLMHLIVDPGIANLGAGDYDDYTQLGWSGPYVDTKKTEDWNSSGGALDVNDTDILYDEWGNAYVYNTAGATITSYGPDGVAAAGDNIVVDLN